MVILSPMCKDITFIRIYLPFPLTSFNFVKKGQCKVPRERLTDEPNAISTGHANPRLHARAYYGKFINGLAVAEIRREQNQALLALCRASKPS